MAAVPTPAGPASLPGSVLSTPVATSQVATPSASLSLHTPAGTFACAEEIISWDASGPISNLTLVVSSYSVLIPTPLIHRDTGSSSIVETIVTGLTPSQEYYPWNPVNVPQGEYFIMGLANGLSTPVFSQPFFVSNDTDVSCLDAPVISVTASGAISSPTLSTVSVSGSSKKHTAGAIAGGVIGGIAFVIALLAAFLLYRRYNGATRSRRGVSGLAGANGRWNGLSSLDSGIHNTLPPPGGKHGGFGAGGTYPTNNGSLGHGKGHSSPLGSDEDLSTLAEEEKPDDRNKSFDYMDTIAPLPYNKRRSSITSNGPYIPSAPSPTHAHPRTRSSGSQNRVAVLSQLDTGPNLNSVPSSPTRSGSFGRRARQSLDGRVLSGSVDLTSITTPTSPPMSAEMIPMNRSSSGGNRRTPTTRKPVPTYDASTVGETESVTSPSQAESVISGGHDVFVNAQANQSGSSSNLHYHRAVSPVTKSREDLRGVGLEVPFPDLNHKSSFGDGRPLHYLIPDMPPPARD